MDELFKIGDVARMYDISVGTLRHYEQAGLLKPEYVDSATGYRYYSVYQLEKLTNIRYLRALGLPLPEIAAYINDRDIGVIRQKLQSQKELTRRKRRELMLIERKIDHRIEQIDDALHSRLNELRLMQLPPCRLAALRGRLKWDSYVSLERSIRQLEAHQKMPLTFEGKVGVGISREHLMGGKFDRYDVVFIILDEEDSYEGNVVRDPGGLHLCIRFRGSHIDAPAHYEKMMAFLRENAMTPAGDSREIALIDNSIAADPALYVTEIRIPVAK